MGSRVAVVIDARFGLAATGISELDARLAGR